MSNARAHAIAAAAVAGACHLIHEHKQNREPTLAPVVTALLASKLGSLPDLLEPAIHPNHRRVFHSVAFGALVIWVGKKLYDWDPETPFEEIVKWIALTAGAAYITHLLLDLRTPKSLPLVGL